MERLKAEMRQKLEEADMKSVKMVQDLSKEHQQKLSEVYERQAADLSDLREKLSKSHQERVDVCVRWLLHLSVHGLDLVWRMFRNRNGRTLCCSSHLLRHGIMLLSVYVVVLAVVRTMLRGLFVVTQHRFS